MPIPIGVVIGENIPLWVLQGLPDWLDDAKVGETVVSYSTQYLGSAAVETEAAAPPKTGPMVSDYNMELLMEIFGELG